MSSEVVTDACSSYDTRTYITAFFVPLFPLRPQRIVDECPKCRKHRRTPLRKWNASKQASVKQALADYQARPDDADNALAFIATAMYFEDDDAFLTLCEEIEKRHAGVAGIWTALGRGYAFFGFPDAAVPALETSLGLEDDQEIRESLALLLLHLSKPREAERHLLHVLEDPDGEKIGLIELLVRNYQSQGMHTEALDLLDRGAATVPALGHDRTFRKLRGISEKHRETGTPVGKTQLPDIDKMVRERRWSRPLAAAVGPALLLALVSGYFYWCWHEGAHRTVHVVNGLQIPYDVTINGQKVHLPAQGLGSVRLAEGRGSVEATIQDGVISAESGDITTPFFARPFRHETLVLNPDRAAVLLWEEASYSESLDPGLSNSYRVHAGELVYAFRGVDYEFREFPESIELSSSSAVVTKQRLDRFTDVSPIQLYSILTEETGSDVARSVFITRAMHNPTKMLELAVLGALMEGSEFVAFLRGRLDERPIHVDWHRTYQEAVERFEPQHDVAAEYRGYLNDARQDTTLLYLLGRVVEDCKEADALLRRAAEGTPLSPYGYNALAYNHMVTGEYEAALGLAERALAIQPDKPDFQHNHDDALHALGLFSKLLAGTAPLSEGNGPPDYMTVQWRVYLLVRDGQREQAAAAVQQYALNLRSSDVPMEQISPVVAHLNAYRAYFGQNRDTLDKLVEQIDDVSLNVEAALLAGRLEDAAKMIEAVITRFTKPGKLR